MSRSNSRSPRKAKKTVMKTAAYSDGSVQSLMEQLNVLDSNAYQSVIKSIANELIGEVADDIIFAAHKRAKTEKLWALHARAHDPNNAPRKKQKASIFPCAHCSSRIASTKYAQHLEKCVYRTSRRSNSRAASTASTPSTSGSFRTTTKRPRKKITPSLPITTIGEFGLATSALHASMACWNKGLNSPVRQTTPAGKVVWRKHTFSLKSVSNEGKIRLTRDKVPDVKQSVESAPRPFLVNSATETKEQQEAARLKREEVLEAMTSNKTKPRYRDPNHVEDFLWVKKLPVNLPMTWEEGGIPYIYTPSHHHEIDNGRAPSEAQLKKMYSKVCGVLNAFGSKAMCVHPLPCVNHTDEQREKIRKAVLIKKDKWVRFRFRK